MENIFTDKELYILSDAMLCLIRQTNKSMKEVYDKESIQALENAVNQYRELNTKVSRNWICGCRSEHLHRRAGCQI